MAGPRVKAALVGHQDLNAVLTVLGPKHFRPAARKGVKRAGMLVSDAAKSKVPRRTNSLRRALGYLVKSNKKRTGYLTVVGPRKDRKGTAVGGTGKGKSRFRRLVRYKRRKILVNPVKYAHLVEGGRKRVRVRTKRVLSDGRVFYGKASRRVAPRPFMKPAYRSTKGAAAKAIWQAMSEAADKVPKPKRATLLSVPTIPTST